MIMKKLNKKIVALVLVLIMIVSTLAGCNSNNENTQTQTSDSDTKSGEAVLVLGAATDFKESSGYESASLVFDLLLNKADDMTVLPGIIESWDINDEKTVYTLHIRKGIKFTDGTPVTAEIVKTSIEIWAPFKDGAFIDYNPVYNVVDENTLEIKFAECYSTLLTEISFFYCSLPGSLDDLGNVVNYVGTGPFILENLEEGQSATLVKNKDYWNKDREVFIDKLVWKTIPDENARVLALQSGDVDAIGVTEHYCSLPYSSISSLEAEGKYNVFTFRGAGLVQTYMYNYLKGPMTDIHLRKAVTYAIDRKKLTESMTFNYGDVSGYFILPEYRYTARKEQEYSYDINKAKSEMEAGGYKDTDGDGIVEKDGKPLKLVLLIESTETARSTAVFVQNNLKEIGIDVEINAMDKEARKATSKEGNFDIAYTHPWLKTPETYLPWRCASTGYDNFGTTFRINDKFDDYAKRINTAKSEEETAKVFDELWADEYSFYPGTPLFSTPKIYICKKSVSGFKGNPEETLIELAGVKISE